MTSPSLDICWSLAEAEAAHAGFSEIGLAHFWVGVCKAVELPVAELLKAGSSAHQAMEAQVAADFLKVQEAFPVVLEMVTEAFNMAHVQNSMLSSQTGDGPLLGMRPSTRSHLSSNQ